MKKLFVPEQYNHLLKIRVDFQGVDQWVMTPEFTKKSHASNQGHIIFRGNDDAFRRYLMRIKATDTESDPASNRQVKYKDMVQNMKQFSRTYIWVFSTRWKNSNMIVNEENYETIE